MAYSHRPVLLGECLAALNVRPDGTYLDGTLGGGGHAGEVLKRLTTGRLIGIDRDPAAIEAAGARLQSAGASVTLLRGNFHDAGALLHSIGVTALDG
ncbi:MAG: 16S rRNA (cytosine(1402)-N(4))-methyltransferase, partial [Clostridiales bacterium]|nr:16S rRNA (cytosine(1402)-N(4))-methyltransferase [Clostridiales bacterium]